MKHNRLVGCIPMSLACPGNPLSTAQEKHLELIKIQISALSGSLIYQLTSREYGEIKQRWNSCPKPQYPPPWLTNV